MDYKNVTRWTDLSEEDRLENLYKTNRLFEYLRKHVGEMVTWSQVNNALGLEHVYRFKVDDYNTTHRCTRLVFDEDGIVCLPT